MKYSERTLLEFIGLVYDAAAESSQWLTVVEKLCYEMHAAQSTLHIHDTTYKNRCLVAGVGMDPAFLSSYKDYYGTRNVFLIDGKNHLRPGNVCLNDTLCPDSVLFKTEFYSDWLVPQRMHRGIDAVIAEDRTLKTILVLARQNGQKPFDDEDVLFIKALMPHLQRAIQLHKRISDLRSLQQATENVLDRWHLGVVLLDAGGHVLLLNRAAAAMTQPGGGLLIDGHRKLRSISTTEDGKLTELISNAVLTMSRRSSHSGGALSLYRPSPKSPLNALVASLSAQQSIAPGVNAACVVFLNDPDADPQSDEDVLQSLYKLTPAESKVASLLGLGEDVKRISEKLRVSPNTTRTHVRKIMDKMGTRRQTQLIQHILEAPARTKLRIPD